MQENNQTKSEFTSRTDQLSVWLDLNLSEIPEIIGISKAMLYAYRSGKNPITRKVWLKLEAAEAAAGMQKEKGFNVPRGTLKKGSDAENSGNPNDPEKGPATFSNPLQDEPARYHGPDETRILLGRIASALEEIARKLPDSTT